MKFLTRNRNGAYVGVGTAFLVACGGTMNGAIGVPSTMAQNSVSRNDAARAGSWTVPEATSEDLLYVSKLTKVLIYSYASNKVVGTLTGFQYATGLCSDQHGDVWVTDARTSEVSEYAHGGTKPIARLSDDDEPVGCAVDPRTGDVTVANYDDHVYIYRHGKGNPAIYTALGFYYMEFCSYDGSGNLYVDGWRGTDQGFAQPRILKLLFGDSKLRRFNLEGRRHKALQSSGAIQWDGKSLVVGYGGKYRNELYRILESSRKGKITKKITLTPPDGGFIPGDAPFIIYKGAIVGTYDVGTTQIGNIAFWSYPRGGTAVKEFKARGKFYAAGLAVSVAPR